MISYRLSPSVSHPAHIQDAAAAVAWVKKNIAKYGGDPNAIFVIGHSAGAYLAALLALDERYLRAEGLTLRDIRGAVPVSGFFFVDRVAPDRSKSIWGSDTRTWIDASPAKYLRADAPPILLIYADGDDDWRRAQNVEMAQALTKAGHKDIASKQISNRTHSSIWGNIREGEEVSILIENFIAQHLKKNTSQ